MIAQWRIDRLPKLRDSSPPTSPSCRSCCKSGYAKPSNSSGAELFRSGSAGLGFQKGNLRSASREMSHYRSRLPTRASLRLRDRLAHHRGTGMLRDQLGAVLGILRIDEPVNVVNPGWGPNGVSGRQPPVFG